VAVTLTILAAIYLRGWLFLRRSASRNASLWRLGSYGVGVASLIAALISPVDTLASERLSMHMLQHILLLMIAPLAILLASPFGPFLWGLPRPLRIRFARLFHRGTLFRSVARSLTFMPVAWGVYVLNLWSWHHPTLYEEALLRPWLHDLEHFLFFLTALLFWWPVANVPPMLHGQLSLAFRIVYLVAATLQNTLLGMAIALPERILYPFYDVAPTLQSLSPIQDQALGGGIMWVSGHMYLIPIIVLIANKLIADDGATNRSHAIPPMNRLHRSATEGH
jgi:putative membrane protein